MIENRVRNYFVIDIDSFKEHLVRDLIRNNINYVQIENEFHFLDKVYRFFDASVEKLYEFILEDYKNLEDEEFIKALSQIDLVGIRSARDLKRVFDVVDETTVNDNYLYQNDEKRDNFGGKRMIKTYNKRINRQVSNHNISMKRIDKRKHF